MPITSKGYEALRANDYLVLIRSEIESFVADAYDGLEVDWDTDVLLALLASIQANRLGELSELTQAIYDAGDPNNAAGSQLDSLASMVALTRIRATSSVCRVSLTGTTGTVVPAGKQISGVGKLWTLQADVTIPGTGDVACVETGPIVAASSTLSTIASPVIGWDAVTNTAPATPGRSTESDAELRIRRETRLRGSQGRSLNSIRTALLALDYVQIAVVIDNPDAAPQTVQGIAMPGCSVLAVVYPDPTTTERKAEVATILYDSAPFGITMVGDETGSVVAPNGVAKDVAYSVAEVLDVALVFTVTLDPTYALIDITSEIETAIAALFETLAPGDKLNKLPLFGIIADIAGISEALVTIDGGASFQGAAVQVLNPIVTVVEA